MQCEPGSSITTANEAALSGLLSTMAGVLSGFAFSTIVVLLVTGLDSGSGANRVLRASGRALVSSFVGLLIMSLLYAALAGSSDSCGPAVSEGVVLSVGFVGVWVLLIHAVIVMLVAAAGPGSDRRARDILGIAVFTRAVACFLNTLLLGMVYEAVADFERVKYGRPGSTLVEWVSAGAFLTQAAVSCVSVWLIHRRRSFGTSGFAAIAGSGRTFVAVGLGLPFAAAAGFVCIDMTTARSNTVPTAVALSVLTVACACTVTTTFGFAASAAATSCPAEDEQEQEAGTPSESATSIGAQRDDNRLANQENTPQPTPNQ
ncbi:hypothetical protein ACFZCK_19240 [Kitasatospora purpeofusca]|uniref:hypothetical protein n=1 Tax=Kitasatospora purpeofusca TaxID=67352 RepID=UPI0036E15F74